MDIREAIRSLAGQAPSPVVVGTVTATDGHTADIQPLDPDAPPLLGVDLALAPGAALAFRPRVGSLVLAVLDSPATGLVLAAADADIIFRPPVSYFSFARGGFRTVSSPCIPLSCRSPTCAASTPV